ncbi:GNAT family N-acetyltransferase [Lysinibacillus yapensis]|uniref:GNAT family N-acetyltransferase n=1 Tax=Ureibacillus yapensis TaxID=2304605 RepID=A0A396SAW9_9BACL|nr:GNAT family N-acetyltransferase [Lysinibacillus yapensis]RHW34005.1 GNAT family N-acetyltransferase [Lysinibacillus yapensis]
MEIRILSSFEDAEKYRSIRLESLKNTPEAFASSYGEERDLSIEEFQNKLQSNSSFTYGAFDQGELVGIITLYQENLNKLQHRAHIGAMYVSPSKRGSGIGKALMEKAIKKAKSIEDLEQVYLAVVSTNESAKKLYSLLGFEVFGTEKKGLKLENNTYFDVDFMILYI